MAKQTKMERFEAVVGRLSQEDQDRVLGCCIRLARLVLRRYEAWLRGCNKAAPMAVANNPDS